MKNKPVVFSAWFPLVTNPQSVNNPASQVFDSERVEGFQIWFGESTPADAWDLTLRLFVDLAEQPEAVAGLLALGRDPEQYSWVPFEVYHDVKVVQPPGAGGWCVAMGEEVISPGWVLTVDQNVPGRVRAEIVQVRGQRRLLLYRLFCR